MTQNPVTQSNPTRTKVKLNEEDFLNLVFMNAASQWDNPTLVKLCAKPLRSVVEGLLKEFDRQHSGYGDPYRIQRPDKASQIFANLDIRAKRDDPESWFEKHTTISRNFDRNKMPPIWIRNVSYWVDGDGNPQGERAKNPCCDYYIEDGCTRSLVYAMRLECGESEFETVEAIHATSWLHESEFLGFDPQPATALVNNGVFIGELPNY